MGLFVRSKLVLVKRNASIAIGLSLIASALLVWRCHGTTRPVTRAAGDAAAPVGSARRDPTAAPRGSIAGTIRDERGAPIAARVCASPAAPELASDALDPVCVATDARGAYRFGALVPADYAIDASAQGFAPGTAELVLLPGEQRSGVDLVLANGGVLLRGTVSDLGGGPVAGAQVRARSRTVFPRAQAITETDAEGRYTLWVRPGTVDVFAVADGYAEAIESGTAPATIDLLLTPASSLAGTVIDAATNEPRPGVRVVVATRDTRVTARTDEAGAFRATRLVPGRYQATVQDLGVFGRSEGTVLVGLGQHVEGVIVRVYRAARVAGTVTIAGTGAPCPDPEGYLADDANEVAANANGAADGSLVAEGVRPGTYTVRVGCAGHQPVGEPRVTVGATDIVDQRWTVAPGGTIEGRVTLLDTPIAGAWIEARALGQVPRGGIGARDTTTRADGSFALRGLVAGRHRLTVASELGHAAPIELDVAAGATVTRSIALAAGGTIRGVVVDPRGTPLARVEVRARARGGGGSRHDWFTGDDGRFAITGLPDGTYRLTLARGEDALRIPASPDGVQVAVTATRPAELRLVVEDRSGAIRGTVTDHAGKPIGDAYVSAAREDDDNSAVGRVRWSSHDRPRLTDPDGKFAIDQLVPGTYTILAYRKGGGEAIAEHVALGKHVNLTIRATGSIAGTIRLPGTLSGGNLDELAITLTTRDGFRRTDSFYRTAGRYTLRDVAPGTYQLRATTPNGTGELAVALAPDEHKTGVDLTLEPLATITGTLVDLLTRKPLPDLAVFSFPPDTTTLVTPDGSAAGSHITDASGRFTIRGARTGPSLLLIRARGDESWSIVLPRTLPTQLAIDLGAIPIVSPRVREGDPIGRLGITFRPDDTWWASPEIVAIDPTGPAATSGLRPSDVLTSVDGISLAGPNIAHLAPLLRAPPGTKLRLEVRRGVVAEIVLAPPP